MKMKYIIGLIVVFGWNALSFAQKESKEINWMSFEEAYEANKSTPKPWMVDISTDWCGWCKRMDQTTFSNDTIIQVVNANFYAVRLDGEEKKDIVLDSVTYSFVESGRRGYNELPAQLMNGKMSYPTIVFLSEKLQNLSPVPGYKSAVDFHPIIQFFAIYNPENPITYQSFMETYTSPFQ